MSILQIIFSILGIVLVPIGIYVQLHRRRLIQQVEKLNPIPMTKIPQLIGLNFQSEKYLKDHLTWFLNKI